MHAKRLKHKRGMQGHLCFIQQFNSAQQFIIHISLMQKNIRINVLQRVTWNDSIVSSNLLLNNVDCGMTRQNIVLINGRLDEMHNLWWFILTLAYRSSDLNKTAVQTQMEKLKFIQLLIDWRNQLPSVIIIAVYSRRNQCTIFVWFFAFSFLSRGCVSSKVTQIIIMWNFQVCVIPKPTIVMMMKTYCCNSLSSRYATDAVRNSHTLQSKLLWFFFFIVRN